MDREDKKRNLALGAAILVSGAIVFGTGIWLKKLKCEPAGIFIREKPMAIPFIMMNQQLVAQELEIAESNGVHNEIQAPREAEPTEPKQTESVSESTGTDEPDQQATEAETELTEPPAQAPEIPPETDPPMEDATSAPETEAPTEAHAETSPTDDSGSEGGGSTGSYFDDVLFIGNSRTCGLRDYARLGNADYFCETGMSVFSAPYETASDRNFSTTTLYDLLDSRQYGKVYIILGINEVGYSYDSLMSAYSGLVSEVISRQPNAKIILHSIMTVGRGKAASEWYFGIDNIHSINNGIAGIAGQYGAYYIDVNEVFADEEGYLPDEMSGDGCHLYAEYYDTWASWLCTTAP